MVSETPELKSSCPSEESWFSPGRFAFLLGLLLACTFPKIISGLHTFFYRDFGVLAYPVIFHHHESFWRGELPLWNPLSNCGAPFLAQWGTMVLYPFSLFYLILPLPWSLNFFCLAHLFLAGLGMYFLTFQWVNNRFAASLAGVAFVFNGVAFSSLMWPNYMVALGWMPWTILAVERAWSLGGRRLVAASFVAALQMLSGVPEIALLTWLLLASLWVGKFSRKTISRPVLMVRGTAIVLLITGLIAAQLLPFLDLLAHSHRTLGVASSKWSMPVWGWANFLVPLFRCFLTPQGIYFQHGQQFLSSIYSGIGVLLLALFAGIFVRERRVWLLAAMALFGLLAAMGENGVVFGAMKRILPVTGLARYPVKFLILTAIALPWLAAYAVRELQNASPDAPRTNAKRLLVLWMIVVLTAGSIVAFSIRFPLPLDQVAATRNNATLRILFLTGMVALLIFHNRGATARSRLMMRLSLVGLLATDVMTHAPNQNPTLPASVLQPGLWAANHKLPAPTHGQGRVLISPRAEQQLLMSGVSDLGSDFLGKRLALWSNLNLLEGIPKVNGSSTLQLREQMQVQALLYASTNQDLPRLADFLGASQMTAPNQILEWTPRDTAFPMLTAGQRPVFAGETETLNALTNSAFDGRRVVYLPPDARASIQVTNETVARIRSEKFSSHEIVVELEADQPSLMVVAQSFYHPWRAFVDEKPTMLWRANHAFQALEVPAGIHRVKLVYVDWKFRVGACVSLLTLVCCVVILIRRRSDDTIEASSRRVT